MLEHVIAGQEFRALASGYQTVTLNKLPDCVSLSFTYKTRGSGLSNILILLF